MGKIISRCKKNEKVKIMMKDIILFLLGITIGLLIGIDI